MIPVWETISPWDLTDESYIPVLRQASLRGKLLTTRWISSRLKESEQKNKRRRKQ